MNINQPINLMSSVPALARMNVDIRNRAVDPSAGLFIEAIDQFATKITSTLEKRQMTELTLQMNKLDQQYRETYEANKELDWQDPDKRQKAMEAFNTLIEQKKKLIVDSNLSADNLGKMELYLNESSADKAYQMQTDMNKIWIKQEIDNNLLAIQEINTAIMNLDINDETSRNQLNGLLFDSIDNLKSLGMPQAQANELLTNALNNNSEVIYSRYIESNIMNAQLLPSQKEKLLDNLIAKSTSDEAIMNDVNEILKGYKGSDIEEVKASVFEKVKAARTFALDKPKSVMNNKMEQWRAQLRDEDFQLHIQTENAIAKIEQDRLNDTQKLNRSLNNSRALEAIKVVDPDITPEGLIESESNCMKYFGKSEDQILKDGEYISTISRDDINNVFKMPLNNSDSPRSESLDAFVFERINSLPPETQKHMYRQLEVEGVLDPIETFIHNNNVENGKQIIDYHDTGKRNKGLNGVNEFATLNPESDLGKKISEANLNNKQKQILSTLIVGSVVSQAYGPDVMLVGGKESKVTSTFVMTAYNNNEDFRNSVDYYIQLIKDTGNKTYRPAKISAEDLYKTVDSKYDNEYITLRKRSQEIGTTAVFEKVNINKKNYTDF